MYTSSGQNPIIENSVLSSKYLDPVYLFDHLVVILGYVFNAKTLEIFYIVLSVLSIFFIGVTIYSIIRIFEIRSKQHKYLHYEIAEYAKRQALREQEKEKGGVFKNEKWRKVLEHLSGVNENDWKLAVIEADSMLLDLLVELGFKGESLGDKLKEANQANFKNINIAWEVHNIRNRIAHEGSSFVFPQREAKRVIALYEQIFREFGFI